MDVSALPLQPNLEQLIDQILMSHKITRHDQKLLMALFSKGFLNSHEKSLFDRVYKALHNGLLKVVD